MADPVDEIIGLRLREAREARGFSRAALARQAGISRSRVQKYEEVENSILATMLWRIADILGVPIDYFFDGLCQEGDEGEEMDLAVMKAYERTPEAARPSLRKFVESLGPIYRVKDDSADSSETC